MDLLVCDEEKGTLLPQLKLRERNRFRGVKVDILGRCMFSGGSEYTARITEMSPGSAVVTCDVRGSVAESVVLYHDHIGRIEGKIVRQLAHGFAITFDVPFRKRDKIATKLIWFANCKELCLPEDRRHVRYVPDSKFTKIVISDDKELECEIIDLSFSGAAVSIMEGEYLDIAVGDIVLLGCIRSRVVRLFAGGLAVEFATVQTGDSLLKHLYN